MFAVSMNRSQESPADGVVGPSQSPRLAQRAPPLPHVRNAHPSPEHTAVVALDLMSMFKGGEAERVMGGRERCMHSDN